MIADTRKVRRAVRCIFGSLGIGVILIVSMLTLTRYPGEVSHTTALRVRAHLGDRVAAYELACCLFKGTGVSTDVLRAEKWFNKAAERGHPEALYRVAPSLDDAGSTRLYSQAAESGHPKSMNAYGVCLGLGRGIERDYSAAAVWLRRASNEWAQVPTQEFKSHLPRDLRADEDREELFVSVDPMTNLAWLVENGRGCAADERSAADLYRRSLLFAPNWLARSRLRSLLRRRPDLTMPSDGLLLAD
jgi:TPR repeat protein